MVEGYPRNIPVKLFQNLSIGLAEVLCVCVYFNSLNDVLRVAQQYGTIAAHTRRHASVLVVFVVFCVHMLSFCLFDKADATADVQ